MSAYMHDKQRLHLNVAKWCLGPTGAQALLFMLLEDFLKVAFLTLQGKTYCRTQEPESQGSLRAFGLSPGTPSKTHTDTQQTFCAKKRNCHRGFTIDT